MKLNEDLITRNVTVITPEQEHAEDFMTALYKATHGDCDNACMWAEPYGWAPECGCPVHDPDG